MEKRRRTTSPSPAVKRMRNFRERKKCRDQADRAGALLDEFSNTSVSPRATDNNDDGNDDNDDTFNDCCGNFDESDEIRMIIII